MKLVPTPSLFHSRNSLLNPLSLMNTSRLFRNFVFLFSLLGLGSLAWGERYETVFAYSADTDPMNQADAAAYLNSNAPLSQQSLTIPQGEVAYVFSLGATIKPNSTISYNRSINDACIPYISVNMNGLDGNITVGPWLPSGFNWNSSSNVPGPSNLDPNAVEPIVGPATIKIYLKPRSGRQRSDDNSQYWGRNDFQNWDFQASEGFVTFRIEGSEQAPSKKFATVIPENASTNIRVVLEQSTDLINWTTAAPGVFPPSTAKRFFRVRSEEE